jgi:hypothetical protein
MVCVAMAARLGLARVTNVVGNVMHIVTTESPAVAEAYFSLARAEAKKAAEVSDAMAPLERVDENLITRAGRQIQHVKDTKAALAKSSSDKNAEEKLKKVQKEHREQMEIQKRKADKPRLRRHTSTFWHIHILLSNSLRLSIRKQRLGHRHFSFL